MRVLVLRHAQAEGCSDLFRAPISKRGRERTLELSKTLNVDLVVCSHFPRSRQTAKVLIGERPHFIRIDPRFGEIQPKVANEEQAQLAQAALDAIVEHTTWVRTQRVDQILVISHNNLMRAIYDLLTFPSSFALGFESLCGFEILIEKGEILEVKLWRP